MILLTDKDIRQIEKKLEKDTNKGDKEKAVIQYAFYKGCLMMIEKVIPELKRYGC